VKLLGVVTSLARLPAAPNVPTLYGEQGRYFEAHLQVWSAPAGTPAAIVEKIPPIDEPR
jgi:tripartite-type tricarboxylate transporter receptor subunit TctC